MFPLRVISFSETTLAAVLVYIEGRDVKEARRTNPYIKEDRFWGRYYTQQHNAHFLTCNDSRQPNISMDVAKNVESKD